MSVGRALYYLGCRDFCWLYKLINIKYMKKQSIDKLPYVAPKFRSVQFHLELGFDCSSGDCLHVPITNGLESLEDDQTETYFNYQFNTTTEHEY